jgi:murein DD-endopeptidase MepM/ murein hydrolase activator NlpD
MRLATVLLGPALAGTVAGAAHSPGLPIAVGSALARAQSGPAAVATAAGAPFAATPAFGTYAWPVQGPVIRPFEPPPGPYGAGHRGIDIAAPFGTHLRAAQEGVVAFAGWVAGDLFISIDHPDGVRTTYSWLSEILVRRGQRVARGDPIGRTGHGHPDVSQPHLHFGARIGDTYIDPMILLGAGSVAGLIHLAPLGPDPPPSALPALLGPTGELGPGERTGEGGLGGWPQRDLPTGRGPRGRSLQ